MFNSEEPPTPRQAACDEGHTVYVMAGQLILAWLVAQVPWKKGGELLSAGGENRVQHLPGHQAGAAEAEGHHQAAVHRPQPARQAGALPLLHV